MCDEAYTNVYGSTDSENFFAVCIDELMRQPPERAPLERMASALANAIARVVAIVREHGGAEPSYLNCALADGEHAVVSRYTDDASDSPESLYYFHGRLYACIPGDEQRHSSRHGVHPVIVSSERLTEDRGWEPIPPNHMVLVGRGLSPQLLAITA